MLADTRGLLRRDDEVVVRYRRLRRAGTELGQRGGRASLPEAPAAARAGAPLSVHAATHRHDTANKRVTSD